MQDKILHLSNNDIFKLAYDLNNEISNSLRKMYPVPRGGIPAAYALMATNPGWYSIVDSPEQADFIIDDIIDSGATYCEFLESNPTLPFFALIEKDGSQYENKWVVFPWEGDAIGGIENNITRLLQYVGEDPTRGGLLETPKRVAKAWKEWCSGYEQNAADILKVFEDGAETYDQMVTVKDIPFYSHCEHHLAPFFGTCTISYIPNGRIVGLSKLSRIVSMYAKRLQVQERLTSQIADCLFEHLQPLGVGVSIKARHLCMESRGTCQQGHHTVTTALKGILSTDSDAKAEFLQQVK
ncbi:FolE GTP cyclohydrolase I [uncultured Caudovirales phage]|uniref:GTP cyclohydrolase I n=1 Tax=uncultured Caudovirales phage TaxID=2100421 RepID=A0A6J5PIN5_9CAUD|nr:FolE GTP cyclohydrolase I [uncultured Caudovirales phage]CAB5226718.1 FolE GTP cyclohydrolase I [uncultured Caudovirales phage]